MNIDGTLVRCIADYTAVIADSLARMDCKLGDEGYIAHYDAVVQLAQEFAERHPPDFDWDTHIANGGDCWDIEVDGWAYHKIWERYPKGYPTWSADAAAMPQPPVKRRGDIDLTLPE